MILTNMFLFIDTISTPSTIILFDEARTCVDHISWSGKHQEFDTLIEQIDIVLTKNSLQYHGLDGIVVITGPGSFTGTRVTTLVANTIGLSFGTPLFPLTIPEFLHLQDAPLPWILPITRKKSLVWRETKKNPSANLENNTLLLGESFSGVSQIENIDITLAHNYQKVIQKISLDNSSIKLQPLYAKEPNVTQKFSS